MVRFWILDYDEQDHASDLLRAIADKTIVPVVDEEAGGIIAYAVSIEAGNQIADKMNEEAA